MFRKLFKFVGIVVIVLLAFNMGQAFSAKQAECSHILVDTEQKAIDIKTDIVAGNIEFDEAAKKFSSCPSSRKGGSLGKFGPGAMVKEFDEAVFNEDNKIGDVVGPVKTQFGWHLLLVTDRTG